MDSGKPPVQSSPFWFFQMPLIYQPHQQQSTLNAPLSQQALRVLHSPYLPGHKSAVGVANNLYDKSINDGNYNDFKSSKRVKKDTLGTVFRDDPAPVKTEPVLTNGGPGAILDGLQSSTKCPTCGKWFRSRQQLSQHMVVHTDERRYMCKYCTRTFKQPSHLHQHHRIHTGEKPYKCPLEGCTRAFPQQSNLNHHVRNHDRPAPPSENTCIFCNRIYASDAVLRNHQLKIHLCDHNFLPQHEKSNVNPSLSGSVPNRLKTGKFVLNNFDQLLDDLNHNYQNPSVNISHQNLNQCKEDISSSVNKSAATDFTNKESAYGSFDHTSFLDGRTTNNDDDNDVFGQLNKAKHDNYEESPFPVTNKSSYLQSYKNEKNWTLLLHVENSNQTPDMGLQTTSLNKKVATGFEDDEQHKSTYRSYTKLMEDLENERVPACNAYTNTTNDNHLTPSSNTWYKNIDSFSSSKANFSELQSVKESWEDNTLTKYKPTCNTNTNDFIRNLIPSNYAGVSVNHNVLATIDVTTTFKASKRKAFQPQRIVRNQP